MLHEQRHPLPRQKHVHISCRPRTISLLGEAVRLPEDMADELIDQRQARERLSTGLQVAGNVALILHRFEKLALCWIVAMQGIQRGVV